MVGFIDQAKFAKRLTDKMAKKAEISKVIDEYYRKKNPDAPYPEMGDMIIAASMIFQTQFDVGAKNPIELYHLLTKTFNDAKIPPDEKMYILLGFLQDAITYPLRVDENMLKKEMERQGQQQNGGNDGTQ